MKFSREKPPIYADCAAKFSVSWKHTIFTYGDTIHSKHKISPAKIAHEQVHISQQLAYGVSEWWQRYLNDDSFRLSQEVEAYTAEIAWIRANVRDYKLKTLKLNTILMDICGAMYGYLVTPESAKLLLGLS